MPLNIDINFRWLPKKTDDGDKKKNDPTKVSSSSSSSSSSSKKTKSVAKVKEAETKKENPVEVFLDWMNQTTKTGQYHRYDVNLPATIPDRMGGLSAFLYDAPITTTGRMQAQLVGQAIRRNSYKINAIYSSPALRCVQTAATIYAELSKGNEEMPKIRVEPALFDWMGWYVDGPPLWMRNKELSNESIPVDGFYKPLTPIDELLLNRHEDKQAFNDRCEKVIRRILASTQGAVLIVTHAVNLDSCARNVLSLPKLKTKTPVFDLFHHKFPYCSTVCLEQVQDVSGKGQWQMAESLPPITGMGYSTKTDLEYLLRQE